MLDKIELLRDRIRQHYTREGEIVKTIIAMGQTKEGHDKEKVQTLETERQESVVTRRKLQAGLSGLLGQQQAIKKAASKQGGTVQAAVKAALELLEDKETKE